jgi:hypothetical protein
MSSKSFLRSATTFVGLLSLGATGIIATSRPSAAEVTQLTKDDEIAIRGKITAWNPADRMVVIESRERDTLAYRVLPTMTPSGNTLERLRPGLTVDIRYYRTVDCLVEKTTPDISAFAGVMMADPAQGPGILGANLRVKLWKMEGMVVRTDLEAKKIDVVDSSGGMIHRTPWIKSEHGQAVLKELKPGDMVTLIFSERTVFEIKPVY